MKEEISRNQITSPTTKGFFKMETKLATLEFCLSELNNIHNQKAHQIYCEQVHVKYNKYKLMKQIEKIEEEFALAIEDK
tara:strand:- start:146 stop:382 length:237 start_codon:yes stop_codon:yes gene_type:complete